MSKECQKISFMTSSAECCRLLPDFTKACKYMEQSTRLCCKCNVDIVISTPDMIRQILVKSRCTPWLDSRVDWNRRWSGY